MGAIHAGIIPQSCGKCQRDPSLKCVWGCETPSQTVVEVLVDDDNNVTEYYSCPVLYISPRVYDWHTKFNLLKKGLVRAMEYGKESVFFVEASGYYEKWLNFYESKKVRHV